MITSQGDDMRTDVASLNATWVRARRKYWIVSALGIVLFMSCIISLLFTQQWLVLVLLAFVALTGVVVAGVDPTRELRLLGQGLLVAVRERWIIRHDERAIEVRTTTRIVSIPIEMVKGAMLVVAGSIESRAIQDALYLDLGIDSLLA